MEGRSKRRMNEILTVISSRAKNHHPVWGEGLREEFHFQGKCSPLSYYEWNEKIDAAVPSVTGIDLLTQRRARKWIRVSVELSL